MSDVPANTLVVPTGASRRRARMQAVIDRGDPAELLRYAEGIPCACVGAEPGEPLCVCKMNSRQVREQVLLVALRRGRLVRVR